jgi:voltage-gated potassium channel Kch
VPRNRVLLAGTGDLYDEVCTALDEVGAEVTGLKDPDDESIRDALGDGDFDVVCVVAREDALPLRIALLVRHLDEDVPLVVTVFDREMAAQLQDSVPHLEVTSLADIVAPSLAGPCIDREITAIQREDDGGLTALRGEGDGPLEREPFEPPRTSVLRSLATSIFAPYDRSAALMFYGLMGLIGMLIFETIGAMMVLDQSFADALYGSTKSLATVGPNEAVTDGPSWFKVVVAASMILTLLSAACFTGGLIERLTSTRLTGLIGRRAVPRRDHIVVVGLGQVGLRLCVFLRECGFSVVAIDTEESGENVGQARRLKVPVVIGRGANPAILRRLSLDRARAVAAVTPDDLANVEAAMAARSINEDLQVVIRGGDGEVADETRSLLRIGHVIDVHRVGAAFIAATTLGRDAEGVAASDGYSRLLLPGGKEERFPPEQPV